MFCDMVGSSALSARLDPEEQSNVIAAFHTCCADEIKALGGMVAQYLGDGVLAYFGYPTAHENDAERAILAGLAILKSVASLRPVADVAMQTRIAIGSGVVVVGDLVRQGVTQENAAIGETTNLVARLQATAKPNSLVISPVTYRLVGALFDYLDLGRQTLKGFSEPVHVRQVLGPSKVESRFEAQHQSGTSPLLGRDEELDLLLRRWEEAKRGEGRVVLLTGEPGIGKSRIARALRDQLRSDSHTPLNYFCSPHHQSSSLYPHITQLDRAAGIERDDSTEAKLDKLQSLLAQSTGNFAGNMPLFAALLAIPAGDRYPSPEMTPQRRKERTLAVLLDQLRQLASQQPVLMVFEDLHWIDPTSLELLSLAIEQISKQRILLLATARPEFTPSWPNHGHTSTLSLNRLGRSDGEALITDIAKGKRLPVEVRDQIIGRTDGVPLFVEELTKTVLESGLLREGENDFELTGPLPPLAIPSTLHASLLARLDRLAAVKDVAQIGAVIGREFSYPLIAAAGALPEQILRDALSQLVGAQLIYQRGIPPDATYQFKHALVQDAAYASLVRSRRQQLHSQIARALEERFPDIVAAEPEIVAHHFTEAGLIEPAIEYWRRAGERFLARSANIEAVKHLSQTIKLLRAMPHTRETLDEELETCIKMGPALIAVKSVSSTEVETLYLRARELVDRLGKTSRRFPVIWGLWYVNFNRGQYPPALEAGKRLLDAAESGDDAGQLLEAHHALWATLSAMGQAADAVVHMERGIALYDRDLHGSHAFLYGGHDPGACCRYHLAVNLWLLGYPDRSLNALVEVLRHTEEIKHPTTRAIALWYAAWVYYQRGNRLAMKGCLEELLALTTEQGISVIREVAIVMLNADAHPVREKLAELHRRVHPKSPVTNWQRVFCLCVLAERYNEGRNAEDGLAILESISTEDRSAFYAPEIHRLEGELRRQLPSPDTEQIERCFHTALLLARRRAEKSLELRAATSLARLWCDQGKRADARELLTPVYDWFTEGLDLPDPKNARVLIDALARQP